MSTHQNSPEGNMERSLDEQAQAWVDSWREEMTRRREIEKLGHFSWRINPAHNLDNVDPELREKILKLMDAPKP